MNHREIQEEMLKKNAEEKWSHNQHKDLRDAPRFVAPHGTMPLMNDAIGRNSNNTQGNISNNMNSDLHTNHATRTHSSKLPLSPTRTQSSNKPPLAPVRDQDRYLPISNVVRIMRRTIPRNGKVSEEAKETMQESVSEFIGFITSEANVDCQKEFRKTVTAEDIIVAMSKLGFEHYVEPLTMYLRKYRESEADPKSLGAAGNMDFEVAVASAPNVLPSFPVVDPPTSVFASPGNRGIYHGGSIGTSQGLYTAPVSGGSGTSLALGIGGGPSASEGVDVEPLTMYLRKYRESEADPKVPRRAAGNMDFEAAVASSPNVLPSFPVVDPPTSMFASPGNRGIYHCGSIGTSQGLYTAPASDGSGTSLALGISGGPSASGAGPSEPPQAGQYFYNPYGHYRN